METVLMDSNERHRIYTGVEAFHKAGYYGKRVIAATGESFSTSVYNPDGNVLEPLKKGTGTGHAQDTAAVFFQAAPMAKLVQLSVTRYAYGDGTFKSGFINEAIPVIKQLGINNMFCSFHVSGNKQMRDAEAAALREVESYFKMFYSAGNDDDDKYNRMMEIDEVCGVGAYKIMVDGQIVVEGFSSESEYVDFAAPDMIYTNIKATKPSDSCGPHSGTSFSAPWLCGMACLVDDFFIDKTGKPLSRPMMMQFFADHCEDIGDEGFDPKMGMGAVRLPDPSTIDINKYRSERTVDSFKDRDQMSSWAVDSIERCLNLGLMNGKGDGIFDPQGTLTREEAACIIDRLYSTITDIIDK